MNWTTALPLASWWPWRNCLIRKSPNATVLYPNMHHQEANVPISVRNGTLWDMEQVHGGIGETGQFHL